MRDAKQLQGMREISIPSLDVCDVAFEGDVKSYPDSNDKYSKTTHLFC